VDLGPIEGRIEERIEFLGMHPDQKDFHFWKEVAQLKNRDFKGEHLQIRKGFVVLPPWYLMDIEVAAIRDYMVF
jgi:hypothetical protein